MRKNNVRVSRKKTTKQGTCDPCCSQEYRITKKKSNVGVTLDEGPASPLNEVNELSDRGGR